MSSSSSSFPFLELPPELRNAIYEPYVIVESGYIYDFETGKLRAANDPEHPIDLALMYTCTQVANEMKGVALRANIITFRTLSSPGLDFRASHFNGIMETLSVEVASVLGHPRYMYHDGDYIPEEAHIRYDKRVLDEVARAYPECQPLSQLARAVGQGSPPRYNQSADDIVFLIFNSYNADTWKEVPSVSREILFYAAEVASKLGCSFPDELSWDRPILIHDLLEIQSMHKPWAIPTEDEINHAIRKFYKSRWQNNTTRIGMMCPFSAASVAIKFLHDTPISTRKYIRKIVIHEDRGSVACPESHAKGLIPFCVENPLLRIERRLDLWRTVLCPFDSMTCILDRDFWAWPQRGPAIWSSNVALWLVEAMDLFRAGMPEKSFSLIFDGDPDPETSSEIFCRVQRDAAWQEAFDEACARNLLPTPSLRQMRTKSFYKREHFPRILSAMTNNESFFIRCNFDIGSSCDVERIIDQNRNCSLSEWHENWWLESKTYDHVEEPFPRNSKTYDRLEEPLETFGRWLNFYIAEFVYPAERWRYYTEEERTAELTYLPLSYPEN
ncbi:hypothetical protein F4801DRAFT_382009 [Xylaria longipes]|nr:hypothetical protein F4801DRAFT_382009 [Xylaria longipes]